MDPFVLQKLLSSIQKEIGPFVSLTRLCSMENLVALHCKSATEFKQEVSLPGVCDLCGAEGKTKETQLYALIIGEHEPNRTEHIGKKQCCFLCSNFLSRLRDLQIARNQIVEENSNLVLGIRTVLLQRNDTREVATTSAEHDIQVDVNCLKPEPEGSNSELNVAVEEEVNQVPEVAESEQNDPAEPQTTLEKVTFTMQENGKVVCQYVGCGKTYSTKNDLRSHQRFVHSKGAPCKCYFCGKLLFQIKSLYEHILQRHVQERPNACKGLGCSFRSSGRKSLFIHMQKTHEAEHKQDLEEIKCNQCSKTFKRQNMLRHSKTHKVNRARLSCEHCHKSCATKKLLKSHLLTHQTPSFRCPHSGCNSHLFRSKMLLGSHMKMVHTRQEVECPLCGATCKNSIALSLHKRGCQTSKKTAMLVCLEPECGKKFVKRHNLQEHIEAVHKSSENAALKCHDCGLTFKMVKYLSDHMLAKHGSVPCPLCNSRFKSVSILQGHQRRLHPVGGKSNSRKYNCKYTGCKIRFLYKSELVKHIKSLHGTKKKLELLECYFCKQILPGFASLQKHISMQHLREQKFWGRYDRWNHECYFCLQKLSRFDALQKHMLGQHLNERYLSCGVQTCNFNTVFKHAFRDHMKNHH